MLRWETKSDSAHREGVAVSPQRPQVPVRSGRAVVLGRPSPGRLRRQRPQLGALAPQRGVLLLQAADLRLGVRGRVRRAAGAAARAAPGGIKLRAATAKPTTPSKGCPTTQAPCS